jgi:hypothetical protein
LRRVKAETDKKDGGDGEKRRVIGCPLSANLGMTVDYVQWDYENGTGTTAAVAKTGQFLRMKADLFFGRLGWRD